jgi:hypothetical protein
MWGLRAPPRCTPERGATEGKQGSRLKLTVDRKIAQVRAASRSAEPINGLYKAEVIWRRAPWRSFEAVAFATMEWVDWFIDHCSSRSEISPGPSRSTLLCATRGTRHGGVTQTEQPPTNLAQFIAKPWRCPNRASRDPADAGVDIASNALPCFFAWLGIPPQLCEFFLIAFFCVLCFLICADSTCLWRLTCWISTD